MYSLIIVMSSYSGNQNVTVSKTVTQQKNDIEQYKLIRICVNLSLVHVKHFYFISNTNYVHANVFVLYIEYAALLAIVCSNGSFFHFHHWLCFVFKSIPVTNIRNIQTLPTKHEYNGLRLSKKYVL